MSGSHQEKASSSKRTTRFKAKKRSAAPAKRSLRKVVDRGTETVERLHRALASWPLDALERVGRLEKPVARVRKLQQRSISARYAFVRGLNREVAQLVSGSSRKVRTRVQRVARRVEQPRPQKVSQPEPVARAS